MGDFHGYIEKILSVKLFKYVENYQLHKIARLRSTISPGPKGLRPVINRDRLMGWQQFFRPIFNNAMNIGYNPKYLSSFRIIANYMVSFGFTGVAHNVESRPKYQFLHSEQSTYPNAAANSSRSQQTYQRT
jgi:hypothetical protein